MLNDAIERIEEIENRGTGLSGLATNFADLDSVLAGLQEGNLCLLYTSPSPRDATLSRMPSSA